MKSNSERKVLEIVEIAALSTLLLIRIFIDSEKNNWIDLLNFISLIVAFVSLYMNIRSECSSYKKFDIITGLFILIMVTLIIVFSFVLAGKIPFNTKFSDIILIITLLLTLPTRLYISVIANIIKD